MLGKPVHHISMVAGNTELISFGVADDVILIKTVLLAEHNAEFNSILPCFTEIIFLLCCIITHHNRPGFIRKSGGLTDFKANMGIVSGSSCMPAAMIPRQVLPNLFIIYKGMNTDLPVYFTSFVRFVPTSKPV